MAFVRRLLRSPLYRFSVLVGFICLVYLAAVRGCAHLQVESYKDAIPPEFEIERTLYHDGTSGIREGCGVAIFKVSQASLARFGREGGAFLDRAILGRVQKPYHRYEPWRPTPPPEDVILLRGGIEGCMGDRPPIWQEVIEGSRGGGFFTTGPEKDLLFLPERGILVFSTFG